MLIVTALAVLCVSSATAQKLGVDWGVIAGLNMADYSVKQVDKTTQWDDVKNDLGWQVGLMASVNVGRLSIEPQLIYVRNKVELTEGGEKASIKGNSLDVPVLVSLRVLGPVRVMAGPVFTVLNDNSGLKDISVEQLREGYSKTGTTPMGRSGKLSEVASTVAFMASEKAGYIDGVTLNVAGGKTRG